MIGDGNLALQTVQDPWAYLSVVVIGLLVVGIRALIKGDLRTRAEVDALTKRAEAAEAAARIRDEQVNGALAVLPQVADVLEKFHRAGEQVRREQVARDQRAEDDTG